MKCAFCESEAEMKVQNVKKDEMEIDLVSQLEKILPARVMPPTWLLVDGEVYAKLLAMVAPQMVMDDHIEFRGWKVISRSNVLEVG